MTSAPIIVTATLGAEDFAWLDGLRRRHFPPERNVLPAHLTLFHHLPPSLADELAHRLKSLTRNAPAPRAQVRDVMKLGRGVAFRIDSPELAAIRQMLVDAFAGLLTPQDQAAWRPHVTVQNKVSTAEANTLFTQLSAEFSPKPLRIVGLARWYYRDGPWEAIGEYRFRG